MLRENFIRMQLRLFKPFAAAMSLKTAREGQDKLGLLMTSLQKKKVINQNIHFDSFEGALITPKDILRDGILLYLHGLSLIHICISGCCNVRKSTPYMWPPTMGKFSRFVLSMGSIV